jgi:hypothetical protein
VSPCSPAAFDHVVQALSDHTPAARLLYLRLYAAATDDEPPLTQRILRERTCLGDTTVREQLTALEEAGFFSERTQSTCMATADSPTESEPELDPENELPDLPPPDEICGAPTSDGSPCLRSPGDEDRCFMHGTEGPPDSHGAPEGNANGKGNSGGGAPEGNGNALKHGFHTATARRLERFDEDQLALFGDYFLEFIRKAENESAAARLASLAVIGDELEGDLIENGVFRDVVDVDQDGDGESDSERTTGRTPKTETLNALLKVTRELRIGKGAEGVTGNDLPPKARVNQHYSNYVTDMFPDRDLPWRDGKRTLGTPQVPDSERERNRRPPTSPGPRGDLDDLLDRM